MTRPEGERLAALEIQVQALSAQVAQMTATLQSVRDSVIEAKAGGRVALGAAAMVGAGLAWIVKIAIDLFVKAKGG